MITVSRVMQPFSAHHLMTLYICTKFQENISKGFRVTELLFCPHHLKIALLCAKFHESISKGLRVRDSNSRVEAKVVSIYKGA